MDLKTQFRDPKQILETLKNCLKALKELLKIVTESKTNLTYYIKLK